MSFLHIAEERYTTKSYDASKTVSDDKIADLKQILRLAPSSINSQPWKFSIVSRGALKDQLATQSYANEERVRGASHLFVFSVVNSTEYFEHLLASSFPKITVDQYHQFVKQLGEERIKIWFANQVYISLGIFLSACASMGIDSTPMEGINMKSYTDILQLRNYDTLFAVAIGYRDSEDSNQPSIKPKWRLSFDHIFHETTE